MGYAMAHKKLWSVHLNDQNGLKFDQDKTFGAVDLRRAFNQVRILDKHGFGNSGEWVGLDVKAMRTQKDAVACKHLSNSRSIFMKLLEISRSISDDMLNRLRIECDYEELDLYIMNSLLGR
jgi:xylose isomerase